MQEPSFSHDGQQTYSNQSATSPTKCFGPRRGQLRIGLPRTKQSVILHLLHV